MHPGSCGMRTNIEIGMFERMLARREACRPDILPC
jgi:hypothetical protein